MLMARARTWIALGLLLSAPLLSPLMVRAQTAPQPATSTPPHHKRHKAPPPLVLPPLPPGPLRQLPMDQIPATPAKVGFENGLLTISAQNSTLGEILRDVHKLTGATIDVPPSSAANERVVVHLGPGAPRDVLAGLLNGSSFNYVMLGSNSDPSAVASVLLTPKPSTAGEPQTMAAVTQNVYQNSAPMPVAPTRFPGPGAIGQTFNQPANGPVATADADDKDDDADADDKDDKDDDSAQTPAQAGTPDVNAATPQVQGDQPDPNAGPKTPQQIMDMLRRAQQPGGALPGAPQPSPPDQ
jgi:hypothetical protein